MSKENEEILISNVNLTGLVKFANEHFGKKSTGKPFTKSDFQQYCISKRMPENFGLVEIRRVKGIESVKLYDLVKVG